MRQTLKDHGYIMNHIPLLCDNESAMKIAYCSHRNLVAHVEQSKTSSRKAKPIACLSKATKMRETTK
jgi:hypothetical protein